MKMKFFALTSVCGIKTTIALVAVVTGLTVSQNGSAASPSELLESGLYQEETKGDIDAAMTLYRQALEAGKTELTAAGQAQFRLGVCYFKKKDFASAMTAFDQVIKDYPEQKKLAIPAADYLYRARTLLPAPWADGEELRFVGNHPGGPKIASLTLTANAREIAGQKHWVFGLHQANFLRGEIVAEQEADAATLRPIRSRYNQKEGIPLDITTLYLPGRGELTLKGAGNKSVEWLGAIYDGFSLPQLIRRLPLATNYTACLLTTGIDTTNGEPRPVLRSFGVVGMEKVTVPAGTFNCFKVEVPNGTIWRTAMFWYSTDTNRYLVKFTVNHDLGTSALTAVLSAINHRRASDPVQYQDPVQEFSLAAPAGWLFDRYTGTEALAALSLYVNSGALAPDSGPLFRSVWNNPKADVMVTILEPDLTTFGEVIVGPLTGLSENSKPSPRSWAESELAKLADAVEGLRLPGTNDWREMSIAGHPACSTTAGGVGVMGRPGEYTLYAIWTFDDTKAVKFYFLVPTMGLEAIRPTLEALARSYTHST